MGDWLDDCPNSWLENYIRERLRKSVELYYELPRRPPLRETFPEYFRSLQGSPMASSHHGDRIEASCIGSTDEPSRHVSTETFRRDPGGVLENVLIDGRSVGVSRVDDEFTRNGKVHRVAVVVPYAEYERLKKLDKLRDALSAVCDRSS